MKLLTRLILLTTFLIGFSTLFRHRANGFYPALVCAATSCSTPPSQTPALPANSSIKVYLDSSFTNPHEIEDIKTAVNAWQSKGLIGSVQYLTTDPGTNAGNNIVRIAQGPTPQPDHLAWTVTHFDNNDPSTTTGADITFDRTNSNPDGSLAYSPGQTNGGDAFLTTIFEHEFGHVLGLDDFRDSNGNVVDSASASVMGEYAPTTNNYGSPSTSPGHISPITTCDSTKVSQMQSPAQNSSGGTGNDSKGGGYNQLSPNDGSGSGGPGCDGGPDTPDEDYDDNTAGVTTYCWG